MKIRLANKNDKEQIISLIVELTNVGRKILGKPAVTIQDLSTNTFEKLLKRNDVKMFVAEENNEIAGLATLYIIDVMRRIKPRAELEELVVTKDKRGKGIGEKLIQSVLTYCKTHNIYALKLSSLLGNKKAHAFYKKQGGKIIEQEFRFDI